MMIQTNPFYLLNIPMSAKKGMIAAAAEAAELGGSSFDGDEVLSMLLSPDARTEAEISWFPGEEERTVQDIRYAVRTSAPVRTAGLRGLSLLNAELYNFSIELVRADQKDLAGFYADRIWKLAEIANYVDPAEVFIAVNRERAAAGITPVQESRIRQALGKRLGEIGEEIDSLLSNSTSEDMYREVICELARGIVSRENMKIRTVISDIIDRYENRYIGEISGLEKRIHELSDKIVSCSPANSPGVAVIYSQLKTAAADWARVSAPMMIKSGRLGLDYTRGAGVRTAVEEAINSVFDDKTFDYHVNKAVMMCGDMRSIFGANSRFAAPFANVVREKEAEQKESREAFKRSGCYRVIAGFFAYSALSYVLLSLMLLTEPDVDSDAKKDAIVFGLVSAAVAILFVRMFIKSLKRKREYEREQAETKNSDNSEQGKTR